MVAPKSNKSGARREHDSMGGMSIPAGALYGASTQRAVENFPISNLRFNAAFIRALGLLKQAAAESNAELGLLKPELAAAVATVSGAIAGGEHHEQFVVDIFQTGSGTSVNMNANEVIANLANLALGGRLGEHSPVHPNDHVNLGQSSNDIVPSATHIAAALLATDKLLPSMSQLEHQLTLKKKLFWDVIKTGRTHLQDATPIRLGQEFEGYSNQVHQSRQRIQAALAELKSVALGGTAVGTGINTHSDFAKLTLAKLSARVTVEFVETSSHFSAQSTVDSVLAFSGALKAYAASLLKIANDIRWLGSGPRAGFAEISLPAVQPGSSIMPGKVNPVIAESVAMVCVQVIGNDATITLAAQAGNFELNVMLPVVAHNLLEAIELLSTASANFGKRCIAGLKATANGPNRVEEGLATGTALVPALGYDEAAKVVKAAAASGETIRQVALRTTNLTADELKKILNPIRMV